MSELKTFPRKTRFNKIDADWTLAKNHCRTTVNKIFTDNEPNSKFKTSLLISEHSPIRTMSVDWTWEDIYSWVATHWSRHKFEKFISTQRDDRKEHTISRNDMPQATPVVFDGYANIQSLIDAFRKRLCYQASPETRQLAVDFKLALHETQPEIADIFVPNCVYRWGCPEFAMCDEAFFEVFSDICIEHGSIIASIRERYESYNFWFYSTYHFSDENEVNE